MHVRTLPWIHGTTPPSVCLHSAAAGAERPLHLLTLELLVEDLDVARDDDLDCEATACAESEETEDPEREAVASPSLNPHSSSIGVRLDCCCKSLYRL